MAVLRAASPCLSLTGWPRAVGRVLGMALCTPVFISHLQILPAILTPNSYLPLRRCFSRLPSCDTLCDCCSMSFAGVEEAQAPSPCMSACNSYLQTLPAILTCNSCLFLPRLCVLFVPASPSGCGQGRWAGCWARHSARCLPTAETAGHAQGMLSGAGARYFKCRGAAGGGYACRQSLPLPHTVA